VRRVCSARKEYAERGRREGGYQTTAGVRRWPGSTTATAGR
jgi:hypothetical protein